MSKSKNVNCAIRVEKKKEFGSTVVLQTSLGCFVSISTSIYRFPLLKPQVDIEEMNK